MEFNYGNQFDTTLIKLVLSSVKDGDLLAIKNNIMKYNLDIKMVKDPQYDQNAFFFAALIKEDNDALTVLKYFHEIGVDPLSKDKLQQTSLYYTAREGKLLCTKFLIEECGLQINEKDLYGQTPIYYAAREGRLNIVKFLVEKGTDINMEDKYGQHCLFYAIRDGHLEVVKYLVQNGADVDKCDKKKMNPLTFAEKYAKMNIVEFLLASGAKYSEVKHEKEKKYKKQSLKKNGDTNNLPQDTVENNIQKNQKFILIKITQKGEKIPLTSEEIDIFKKQFPDVANLLQCQEALDKEMKNTDEELKQYDSWEKQAKKLMASIWKFRDSEIFHKPVDPMELGIPDYFDIIENPMDFSTIKKKLNNFHYTNLKEFCQDMNLVFDNCILYNGERSVVGAICSNVRNEYKRIFAQMRLDKFL